MMTKDYILNEFSLFSLGTGGIGSWLTENTDEEVFNRLSTIEKQPLTKVQLNQLLSFAHEATVSDDFFHYYWLTVPPIHPYEVNKVVGFQESYVNASAITSIEHLKWGLYRLYIDGLLYFGHVRTAFRNLRSMNNHQLSKFFGEKRFDTERIKQRGPALPLTTIPKDDRHLISRDGM